MRLYAFIFGLLFLSSSDCLAGSGNDSNDCSVQKILGFVSTEPQEPGLRDDSIAKSAFQLISDSNCVITPEFLDALALIAVFERFASRQLSGLFLDYIGKGGNMDFKMTLSALFFLSEFRGELIVKKAKYFQIDSVGLINKGVAANQYIFVFQAIMDKIENKVMVNPDDSIDVQFILIDKLINQPDFKAKYKYILNN